MPKASFAAKDGYEPKLGFVEGNFEVVEACTKVFQYPPNKETQEQYPPFLAAVLMMAKTDEKGNRLDEEPLEKILRIEKDLSKMRPGKCLTRDDQDPIDQGDELDTEGNTCFCEEGVKINVNSAFLVFTKSLEERGFKSEILGAGFLPDLVGLKGHAKTEKGEKRTFGGREIEPNYLIVDRILERPYEKAANGTAKKGMGKAGSTAAAGTTGTAAKLQQAAGKSGIKAVDKPEEKVEEKPVEKAEGNDDAADAAIGLLAELSGELAGETRDKQKLYAMAYARLVRNKDRDKKLDKQVIEYLKSDEWLTEKAAEMGFEFAEGVFTFVEAA